MGSKVWHKIYRQSGAYPWPYEAYGGGWEGLREDGQGYAATEKNDELDFMRRGNIIWLL